MPEFFTSKGDDGTTGVLGEGRLSKAHPLIEALGTLDEASAALGFARASLSDPSLKPVVIAIQRDLYQIMAEVAATPQNQEKFKFNGAERLTWLENQVQDFSSRVTSTGQFILPGDNLPAAAFAIARTVVRRAERRLVDLQDGGHLSNLHLIQYMNRLSTLCYILELRHAQTGNTSASLAKGENQP